MKKFFSIASIFLILASFIGCDVEPLQPTDDEIKTGSISGVVQFDNSTDHAGITVELVPVTENGLMAIDYCNSRGIKINSRAVKDIVETDSNGNYAFKDVAEGTYTIYASSNFSNQKAIIKNVNVRATQDVTLDIVKLEATGDLNGSVTIDGKTDGVLGLEIFLAGTQYSAKVGNDGKYFISDIPVLSSGYDVYIQKGEYIQEIKLGVKVEAGKSNTIENIDLDSKNWIKVDEFVDTPSSQITCVATEDGISFKGFLLNSLSSSGISYTSCEIIIRDTSNDVTMKVNYSRPSWWEEWNVVYPLVQEGKEYNFVVSMHNNGSIIAQRKFTVTAIGGLGEYKVENPDYEVTLDKDKVLSRTKQEFSNNKNVPILECGTRYAVYSNNDEAPSIWDGIWLFEHNSSELNKQKIPLKEIQSIGSYRTYEDLEELLIGRRLGVRTITYIKVAGFTYNNGNYSNCYFELNDYKEAFFDWDDKESKKAFVMYGISVGEEKVYFSDVPNVEKRYLLETEKGLSFVAEGTPNAMEVYGKVVEMGDTIKLPAYIPNLESIDLDEQTKAMLEYYAFTGEWKGYYKSSEFNLPYSTSNLLTNINEKALIDNLYLPVFVEPVYKQVKAKVSFYEEDKTTLISSKDVYLDSYSELRVTLPEVPKKEGYIGYWGTEGGSTYEEGSTCYVDGLYKNFYASYREEIFSTNDLYYLDSYSSKTIEFNAVEGNQYKIIWADSYDGKSDVKNLLSKKGVSSSQICDVKVSAFDENGNGFFYNYDSGFNNPRIIAAYSTGKITIEIQPYSDKYGYFALAIKEM